MSPDPLDVALANGAIVVTPNNRLARQVALRHDAAQRAAGHATWRAVRALPWRAFVDALWTDAIAHNAEAIPVAPAAALHLWQSIVESDDRPLLDARGAARTAAEAYEWFFAYREGEETWRGWQGSGIGDDAATFARWATRYHERLRAARLLDRAEVPDRLARSPGWLPGQGWSGPSYSSPPSSEPRVPTRRHWHLFSRPSTSVPIPPARRLHRSVVAPSTTSNCQ